MVDISLELKETLLAFALVASEVAGSSLVTEAYDTPKEKLADIAETSWVRVLKDIKESTAWGEKIAEIKLANRAMELKNQPVTACVTEETEKVELNKFIADVLTPPWYRLVKTEFLDLASFVVPKLWNVRVSW